MFDWFQSNPGKKLDAQYHSKLEEAMQAQRKGDIRLYGVLTAQVGDIRSEMLVMDKLG